MTMYGFSKCVNGKDVWWNDEIDEFVSIERATRYTLEDAMDIKDEMWIMFRVRIASIPTSNKESEC
jgi:hypothetical protein